jgi:leader peptidase (prepilin peptidase)/N-methyltransferase
VPAVALILAWAVLGAAVGVFVRWGSIRLAKLEGLEPGSRPWQVYGPVGLTALLFAVFAWQTGFGPLLVIRSLWLGVLVQVIFFDFEHQLILDRVILPGALAALLLSAFTPGLGLLPALLTGLVTGLAFLAVAALGSFLFKAEAMGLGDVKFSVFLGLILGPRPTFDAVVLGLVLAGVVAIALVALRRRSMRDSIPYGPFLATGAIAGLYILGQT